jgi:hypothetical protein
LGREYIRGAYAGMTGFFRDDLNDYNKGEVQRVSPTIFLGKDEAPTVWIGEGLLPEEK